ncbi:MAG: 3-oxoacyl-ACP reductase FabG [Thermoleophilia bacterium]|nr:3-oxoacyl-ACP reductase FabG [Thermoleophilia bacterium]
MSLEGKVGIVTGAGRGIGRATAVLMAREGAKVVLVGRSGNIDEVGAEIEKAGGEAFPVRTDVSDPDAGPGLARKVIERYGRVDLLVNNAGVHPRIAGNKWPTILETDVANWDCNLDNNARGPFFLTKAIIPHMIEQRYGRVVFVSSVTGMHGRVASPAYNASKAALICMTKSFADEFGKYNITVNGVAPGYVDTPMNDLIPPEAVAGFVASTPLRRAGRPEDLAHAILMFLREDLFVTGQTLVCDGGLVMH